MSGVYTDAAFEELYDFFMNAPVGLRIMDQDHQIRMANEADLRMTGYHEVPAEYLGRPFTDFHADQEGAEKLCQQQKMGKTISGLSTRLRRRDGSKCTVIVNSNSRIANGVVYGTRYVTFPDPDSPTGEAVAGRAIANALVQFSERERRALFNELDDFFENAPVGLHIVGADGLIRRANRMELETLGYQDAPDCYLGHHIAQFHSDQAVIDEMLELLLCGRPLKNYRANLLRRDGSTLPVFIYSSPRFAGDRFLNTRCFTFPLPLDTPALVARFSWPRNETESTMPASADPMTIALKRLAGRKSAEESLGFLAELGKTLQRDDYLISAAAACSLIVPFIADWCAIELHESEVTSIIGAARTGAVTGSDELLRTRAKGAKSGEYHGSAIPFRGGDTAGNLLLIRHSQTGAFGPADLALLQEAARRIGTAVELGKLREKIADRTIPS
jgi:PAS domain S-box-containing protein